MTFRVNVPLGNPRWYFRACVDGQFGTIIKVYREWKISGDDKWLEGLWEKVKGSLEFAWSPENTDKWDYDKDGVLEGSQHHTLDMELFGPNAWLTGYYLAALKAASEMARYLGDNEKAKEYSELFNKGRSWVEENLFNGEYYIQQIDVTDKNILMNFPGSRTILGEPFEKSYWNEESGEIKYQLGDGCMIDQLSSQWHANNCGLGEILKRSMLKKLSLPFTVIISKRLCGILSILAVFTVCMMRRVRLSASGLMETSPMFLRHILRKPLMEWNIRQLVS